jgi:filamentation induced by cAMP protein fic
MQKAGTYISHGSYKSFLPRLLNEPIDIDYKKHQSLFAEAMFYLGELNAYSQLVPDVDHFIHMYIAKEAVASSRIECIQTSLRDVIDNNQETVGRLSDAQRNDLEEVQNYIRAVNMAVDSLKRSSLASELVCEIHKVLFSGVRGYAKAPGKIRHTQNWIGGGDIGSAVFIPPSPDILSDLLLDLEGYWRIDLTTPPLIKSAIAHYQFETIHPFLDGNGRLGRIIILLQLANAHMLSKPVLCISDYLERHRDDYYDALEYVHITGNYGYWVWFFLEAVVASAQDARDTLCNIVDLRSSYRRRVRDSALGAVRQKNALKLIADMYIQPVLSKSQAKELLNMSTQTVSDLIDDLEKIGILKEITGDETKRRYELYEYFALFNGGDGR